MGLSLSVTTRPKAMATKAVSPIQYCISIHNVTFGYLSVLEKSTPVPIDPGSCYSVYLHKHYGLGQGASQYRLGRLVQVVKTLDSYEVHNYSTFEPVLARGLWY